MSGESGRTDFYGKGGDYFFRSEKPVSIGFERESLTDPWSGCNAQIWGEFSMDRSSTQPRIDAAGFPAHTRSNLHGKSAVQHDDWGGETLRLDMRWKFGLQPKSDVFQTTA